MNKLGIGLLVLATAAGCKKKETPATTTTTPGSGSAPAMAMGSGSGSGSAAMAMGSGSGSAEAPKKDAGFDAGALQTPESVLYVAADDSYLVSNINGKPAEADDNGYIQKVKPDGGGTKWIDGSAADVKLDAPKGMWIAGDTLYVADITVVRQFDAKTGKQKADIKIPGATFLNDVSSDGADGVFVSDTGMDANFKPTGTDAIWHITKDGKATALVKNKDLGGPNGVWPGDKGGVWTVTFRTGELYEVDAKGKKGTATKLPKGQLDGLIKLDNGDFLVSSWEGKNVYRGKPGGEWKEVATDVEAPADIGYDSKRKKLLIPQFMASKVVVKDLP
jgi:hypothetical protein